MFSHPHFRDFSVPLLPFRSCSATATQSITAITMKRRAFSAALARADRNAAHVFPLHFVTFDSDVSFITLNACDVYARARKPVRARRNSINRSSRGERYRGFIVFLFVHLLNGRNECSIETSWEAIQSVGFSE